MKPLARAACALLAACSLLVLVPAPRPAPTRSAAPAVSVAVGDGARTGLFRIPLRGDEGQRLNAQADVDRIPKDREGQEAWARARWPQIAWDFQGMHPQNSRWFLSRFRVLALEWPDVAASLTRVRSLGEKSGVWPQDPDETVAWARWDTHEIQLRSQYFAPERDWVIHIADHEFGHQVEFFQLYTPALDARRKAVQAFVDTNQKYAGDISDYAKKNKIEGWAEGFQDRYRHAPADYPKYTRRLHELLAPWESPARDLRTPGRPDLKVGDQPTVRPKAAGSVAGELDRVLDRVLGGKPPRFSAYVFYNPFTDQYRAGCTYRF